VRRERPFALMVPDLEHARRLVDLDEEGERLLLSAARPVVVAEARAEGETLAGVSPDNLDLGVMLPYAPLHHLLFASGAPRVLVMTSANRSNEPIAFEDGDACERLAGVADAFLVGERPIARRIDDSVVASGAFGPMILRRSRGYAPGAVARLPDGGPVLAVGADLKNAVTLAVNGEAFVSQHVGDLDQHAAGVAHGETIADLVAMYHVAWAELVVAHDLHPEYRSTLFARELPARRTVAVQHHRAHVASVLAERGCFEETVLGVAFDGTGFGDDGSIWGGELFQGSVAGGLERVGHLEPALLPGGDAAARHPAQAAAGFLAALDDLPDLRAPPFSLPERYFAAARLVAGKVRSFPTTSVGRLFDTVAALLGYCRPATFEGQAAIWLEHLARAGRTPRVLPLPFADSRLDYRPLLHEAVSWRLRGGDPREIARAFHQGVAAGLWAALERLADTSHARIAVLSGGVFQNRLLLRLLADAAESGPLELWTNTRVPANDGGISLGQAALARCACG
jgi:hydrogenase maturation protein HypF